MRNILEKYLISIETEKSHRLQAFFAQNVFKQNTLFFHIFGVKGADLPTTQYFKLAVANRERPLSPAELGCTLSHVQAIEHFLETDQQYAAGEPLLLIHRQVDHSEIVSIPSIHRYWNYGT